MLFRQLFDAATSTYTYLIADPSTREAVLIDTVFEQHLRDLALIRELGLDLRYVLETHVHADHVTGAWLLKQAVGCDIAVAKASGAEGADRYLDDGDVVKAGSLEIGVRTTPGHTDGCLTFVLDAQRCAFTGDALLIRGAGRTDFQQGDPKRLYQSVREKILGLPGEYRLYPAHDYSGRTMTTVAEEKANNPRLADRVREEDFVGYMNNLGLPHPKRMDAAVPANLKCGRPDDDAQTPATSPEWGPAIRTFAGVWQIDPEWVQRHLDDVTVIDVRETAEVEASPLGKIAGSKFIPLSTLRDEVEAIPKDQPVVFVCPAGARSAIAATILHKGGVETANMRGGLLEWMALGLPLER